MRLRPVEPSADRHEIVLLVMGIALAVSAVTLARAQAAAPSETFSVLWIQPAAGATTSATIGIESHERREVTYRLDVLSGGQVRTSWPAISLRPGDKWVATVGPGLSRDAKVEARLYLGSSSTVYRSVQLLLPGGSPPAGVG
jgi:hypothetical protein